MLAIHMWIESDSTYASDGYHMQEYGVGGDIDGDLVVIGASEDGIGTGVAYVYDLLTPMPVELASFAAYVKKSNVYLSWTTSSESNNIGFDIQQERAGSWESVGFVPGNGTLTVTSNYSFLIEDLQDGTHSFRLGQIDVDGNYKFSDLVSAVVSTSTDFKLRDVYPNPFGTTVELSLWVNRSQDVSLTVFAADGRRVALLNNGFLDVGKHDYTLDAGNLSSGLYLVRVVGEKTVRTQLIIRL